MLNGAQRKVLRKKANASSFLSKRVKKITPVLTDQMIQLYLSFCYQRYPRSY